MSGYLLVIGRDGQVVEVPAESDEPPGEDGDTGTGITSADDDTGGTEP